ncbi:MAG: 4-(cytidine 5'-diphospho)-2-C-methyl-D-erythritol kinase [Pseudomonadota bacterium]
MRRLYDVPAPAKLNLFLHVVGKRPDGYHLLQSVFVLLDWHDTLHVERRLGGALSREDLGTPLPEDDLCLRAARQLQAASGTAWGAHLSIDKRLPSGAGLGGGSSDAASTLLALNRLWGLNWPRSRLQALALPLGADVPFFIGGQAAWVEGIGEQLTPLTLPAQHFLVVKPPEGAQTQRVFRSPLLAVRPHAGIVPGFLGQQFEAAEGVLKPRGLQPESEAKADASVATCAPAFKGEAVDTDANELLPGLSSGLCARQLVQGWGQNDLQAAAQAECPPITQALAQLEAEFGNSRMTGSGSAVFARLSGEQNCNTSAASRWLVEQLPPAWLGRVCVSQAVHPLRAWATD